MTLEEALGEIEDTRIDRCKKHKLVDILMIVFFGLMSGHRDIEDIHFNAEMSEETLKKYLELPNGIPSSDTILRVLAMIDTKQLEKVFINYAREAFGGDLMGRDVIAIDGKTERNSEYAPQSPGKDSHKAVHIISAWANRLGVCFGQVKTEEKSNEITAIPELLDLLEVKGAVVTIDAMGCQKKIVEKIREKKADYAITLKGNQGKIHDDARELFSHELDGQYCKLYGIKETEGEVDIGHGRIEKRKCWLCTKLGWLDEKSEWKDLNGIGMIESVRINKKTGEQSTERRYFITSLTDAGRAAASVRAHWGVENGLHWRLDCIFGEDLSTLRRGNSAQNMNALRKITLNALGNIDFSKFTRKKKLTLKNKMELCNKFESCFDLVAKSL